MEETATIFASEYLHLKNIEKEFNKYMDDSIIYVKTTTSTGNNMRGESYQVQETVIVSKDEAMKDYYNELNRVEHELIKQKPLLDSSYNEINNINREIRNTNSIKIKLTLLDSIKSIINGYISVSVKRGANRNDLMVILEDKKNIKQDEYGNKR